MTLWVPLLMRDGCWLCVLLLQLVSLKYCCVGCVVHTLSFVVTVAMRSCDERPRDNLRLLLFVVRVEALLPSGLGRAMFWGPSGVHSCGLAREAGSPTPGDSRPDGKPRLS